MQVEPKPVKPNCAERSKTLNCISALIPAERISYNAEVKPSKATGKIEEVPATAFIIGTFKEFPLGTIKAQEKADYETAMAVTYTKLIVNKVPIFEIDVLQNIYKVGNVDILKKFKSNTGA